MNNYNREELINICEQSVVHHTKWNNRDSYSSQKNIQSIYEGLTAGLDFTIDDDTNDNTIWITFNEPIDFDKLHNGKWLNISDLDDYRNDCDPEYETEMFVGYGIDFRSNGYKGGYMPTQKKLDEVDGEDWY